ncbi:MAG: N-acetylmuramoyl-L-alanine amidase [Pseudomonadota bacterium]
MLQLKCAIVSPNYDQREPGSRIEYIILHYTACDFDLSVDVLTDAKSNNPVSAHYLIDEQGEVFQLVPDAMRAWHAGVSAWRNRQGLNTWSLGIEMVHPGHGPFAQPQLRSCLKLCQVLMQKYAIPPKNILGHSDIAPTRKADPGEYFDWQGFAEHGVGIYPNEIDISSLKVASSRVNNVAYVQELLKSVGYEITCDGVLGKQTKAVITAFQRHFYPQKIDGEMDGQGLARLLLISQLV